MLIQMQRKLVNGLHHIGLGSLGQLVMPKEDKEKLAELVKGVKTAHDFVKGMEKTALEKYPDTAIWFVEAKVKTLPGAMLIFNDAIYNLFTVLKTEERFFDFFRKFVLNDESYKAIVLFFATIQTLLENYGALDDDGGPKLTKEEDEALDLMVVRTLVGKLGTSLSSRYTGEQLTYALIEALDDDVKGQPA